MANKATLDNDFYPRSVLIVEDSEADLMAMTRHMQKKWPKTKIMTSSTIEESFACCQKNHFDLVFLDLNLPDSWGPETVKEFRKFNLGAPVVVVTGMELEAVRQESEKFGAAAVVSKSKLLSDDFDEILMEDVFRIPKVVWG